VTGAGGTAAIPPALLRRLIDAAEADRAAVANGLHDDAVQALAASVMHLGLLERRVPEVAGQPAWERAKENLDHGVRATRAVLVDLRPAILGQQGLVAALRHQLERVARQAGCATRLDWDGPDRLDPLIEALAFRAAQEALANAATHANPGLITVAGRVADQDLAIEVSDDGRGMPPGAVPRCPTAWLHVELAGGGVTVGPAATGSGTTVAVWFPHRRLSRR
jgi:signal transduction histidine kinase